MTSVGVLHPGEMGAALAAAARTAGAEVGWVSTGRSPATRARANTLRLWNASSIAELAARSDIMVSICPPEAAEAVAAEVAATGFSRTYLDANAVSPETAQRVTAIVDASGATYVDGAVIGGPDRLRLYLSGDKAAEVATAFGEPARTTVLTNGGPTAASALKMVYAGWSKGSTALLLAVSAAARQLHVEEELRAEWASGQPGLLDRLAAAGPAAKAWRWAGEMDEIAASLASAGLPDGFHRAAAEVYGRLTEFKNDVTVAGDEVLDALLASKRAAAGDVDADVRAAG